MKKILIILAMVSCLCASAADLVITNTGGLGGSGGTPGQCPGPYNGYVIYTKPVAQGWGWKPTASTNVHVAIDTNMVNARIEAVAKTGARYCGTNSVTLPLSAPTNTAYRFSVYFQSNGVSPYTLHLHGFNP